MISCREQSRRMKLVMMTISIVAIHSTLFHDACHLAVSRASAPVLSWLLQQQTQKRRLEHCLVGPSNLPTHHCHHPSLVRQDLVECSEFDYQLQLVEYSEPTCVDRLAYHQSHMWFDCQSCRLVLAPDPTYASIHRSCRVLNAPKQACSGSV